MLIIYFNLIFFYSEIIFVVFMYYDMVNEI